MAKLSSGLLPKVKSGALLRITKAETVAEAIATVTQRVQAATLISEKDVLDRASVSGIVLQGGASAKVLTGKDGNGRPHVSLRTQFLLATKEQCASFLASVVSFTSIEDVQEAYYGFIDEHGISAVIWDNEPCWALYSTPGLTFSGYLRCDAVTGDVSIAGITPEKPARVIKARTLTLEDSAPEDKAETGIPTPPNKNSVPTPPKKAISKLIEGNVYTVESLLGAGWTQDAIDALPNA